MNIAITKQSIIDAFHQLKAVPTHGRTFRRHNGVIQACPIGVLAYLANPKLTSHLDRDGKEVEEDALEYGYTGYIAIDTARLELDMTWEEVSEIISAFDDADDFGKNPQYGQLYDDVRAARNELRAEAAGTGSQE